jgi:argininosuccinate synthase
MNASFGKYGEMNKGWTAADAKGFIKLLSNPGKIANYVHHEND